MSSIRELSEASITNSKSIEKIADVIMKLHARIEALEAIVKELENPPSERLESAGSGTGHYGGGPWG